MYIQIWTVLCQPSFHFLQWAATAKQSERKNVFACFSRRDGVVRTGYCCIQVLQRRPVLEPSQVMWTSDNGNLEHMEIQLALHIWHGWVSHICTHTDTEAVEVLSSAMFHGEIPHLTLTCTNSQLHGACIQHDGAFKHAFPKKKHYKTARYNVQMFLLNYSNDCT